MGYVDAKTIERIAAGIVPVARPPGEADGMARIHELIERIEKLEAEVVELHRLIAAGKPKSEPKPRRTTFGKD